jgi:hypothetical protein
VSIRILRPGVQAAGFLELIGEPVAAPALGCNRLPGGNLLQLCDEPEPVDQKGLARQESPERLHEPDGGAPFDPQYLLENGAVYNRGREGARARPKRGKLLHPFAFAGHMRRLAQPNTYCHTCDNKYFL